MLPEDVEGITLSTLVSEDRRQRRRVEFGESDGESDSDSEGDESDNDEEEGERQEEELQVSARSKKKRRTHIGKRSTERGEYMYGACVCLCRTAYSCICTHNCGYYDLNRVVS